MNDTEDTTTIAAANTTADVIEKCADVVLGIDHIAVAVENLASAIDWYASNLGFSLVERRITHGQSTAMASAVMRAGGAIVVLIQGTSSRSQVSRFIQEFGPGVHHVALQVNDIDVALQRVGEAGGAAATQVIRDVGIRQVFLRRDAGSGVRLELIERRGGDFSDKTVEELFRKFEADDLY